MKIFDRVFGPPTEADFAKLFMAEMKRVGNTRAASFDPEEFPTAEQLKLIGAERI